MTGDRKNDIDGEHKNGIQAAAVLDGYGNQEEFLNAGADYIIKTAEELGTFLKNS